MNRSKLKLTLLERIGIVILGCFMLEFSAHVKRFLTLFACEMAALDVGSGDFGAS